MNTYSPLTVLIQTEGWERGGEYVEALKARGHKVTLCFNYRNILRRKTFQDVVIYWYNGDDSEEISYVMLDYIRKLSPKTAFLLGRYTLESEARALRADVDGIFDNHLDPDDFAVLVEVSATRRGRLASTAIVPAFSTGTADSIATRIEEISDNFKALRINSISDELAELDVIAARIRLLSTDLPPSRPMDDQEIREHTRQAFPLLIRLFDVIGSERGGQMIIAGAVSGLVSLGGWPAVTAFSLCMGAWAGKDAFVAAVRNANKIGTVDRKGGKSR